MSDKEIERLLEEVSGKLSEVKKMIIKENKVVHLRQIIFGLEDENFRIDSSDWKETTNEQGIVFLENLEGDVFEYIGGVGRGLIGEQLFTWEAAMRETEKAGKRMPTNNDFDRLKEKDFGEIVYVGSRYTDGSFNHLGMHTNFWSSSTVGSNAWSCNLYSSHPTVRRFALNPAYGFSVRCLKSQ